MNSPRVFGLILLAAASCVAASRERAAPRGAFAVTAYGARGDGKTDDTAAFQKAIDAASVEGGSVSVPPGKWLCKGHLILKMGVHLEGSNYSPLSWEPATGAILMPTEGRDDESASPFIRMTSATSVSGLTIYYPEQKVEDIRAYPWTIQIDAGDTAKAVSFDATVENVTLINSYNGIRTGPHENGRHRLNSVFGCVLRRGVLVDWTGDIGRIENVHFHSHYWANRAFNGDWNKVFAYMQNNLEAFVFGRTDWEYVTNTFVFPAKVGYRFIQTSNGACNGQFSGIGADATATAVMVDAIQPQGLQITNGEFNSHLVGPGTQIVISKGAQGSVRFENCAFWGPVQHNAVLSGDGFVSFENCYFSNDDKTDRYSIVAESGRLQVIGCTFDARSKERSPGHAGAEHETPYQAPCVDLRPGVKHAIVTGNNGFYGVDVRNGIGGAAIIENNEPQGK